MAVFPAGSVRDFLKNISDWVLGTHEPKVQISGSKYELYGATVADRPDASTVPVGAIFMAVQTQEIWQSDGTDWVVM